MAGQDRQRSDSIERTALQTVAQKYIMKRVKNFSCFFPENNCLMLSLVAIFSFLNVVTARLRHALNLTRIKQQFLSHEMQDFQLKMHLNPFGSWAAP